MKYTKKQLNAMKQIVEYAELCADVIGDAMKDYGLDEIAGTKISITVDPSMKLVSKLITYGSYEEDSGYVTLARGEDEKTYACTGKNSYFFNYLFADEKIKAMMQEILSEMDNPPDSIWLKGLMDDDMAES